MVVSRSSTGTGTSGCPSLRGSFNSAGSTGTSLIEVTLVLAIVSCLLGVGLPALTNVTEARRARDAAEFVAGQLRMARQRAVLTGRHNAIVFEDLAGETGWRVCEDRDWDGVSREDIGAGVDRCEGPAQALSLWFSQVRVGYAPGVPNLEGDIDAAPLRFGLARMAVFSPTGTSSSGTLAVLGEGGNQFMVRVAGVTGRTRVLRFDRGRRVWVE